MNFLAHLYLSSPHEPLMVGNFIADGIKGNKWNLFPESIAKGILMHRHIDSFTDTHAITAQSKKMLYPQFGKWSGVIVDVFYDHFLAKHWFLFHHQPLKIFTEETYKILFKNWDILPERNQKLLEYMSHDNWLLHYATIEGIEFALTGMSQRRALGSGIEKAPAFLLQHYAAFEKHFLLFMPEIKESVRTKFGEP